MCRALNAFFSFFFFFTSFILQTIQSKYFRNYHVVVCAYVYVFRVMFHVHYVYKPTEYNKSRIHLMEATEREAVVTMFLSYIVVVAVAIVCLEFNIA